MIWLFQVIMWLCLYSGTNQQPLWLLKSLWNFICIHVFECRKSFGTETSTVWLNQTSRTEVKQRLSCFPGVSNCVLLSHHKYTTKQDISHSEERERDIAASLLGWIDAAQHTLINKSLVLTEAKTSSVSISMWMCGDGWVCSDVCALDSESHKKTET